MALPHANRNTYLWRDTIGPQSQPTSSGTLSGLPISVKDCFDLAGAPTSLGTRHHLEANGIAQEDSWLVARLRAEGALITGKTHMQELAYGITGENSDFGPCLQPTDPTALTGGSSSGAAASVLEGSAYAAIGTDTGGSIRVPAALCGLAGYRASLGRGDWRGAWHLAESFDTMGWLFRNLTDAPRLGSLFGPTDSTSLPRHYATVPDSFLADCEPEVLSSFHHCQSELNSLGLTPTTVDVDWWQDSREIFAAIQAWEAARHHPTPPPSLEPSIRQRLAYGASLTDDEITHWRARHTAFRTRMDSLLAQHSLLLLPVAPLRKLEAGADHSANRPRILRYTTPISLSGMPAITIPYTRNNQPQGGMQLIAAREDDARLLSLAAALGRLRE